MSLHEHNVSTEAWCQLQESLGSKAEVLEPGDEARAPGIEYAIGVDVSFSRRDPCRGVAAAVVVEIDNVRRRGADALPSLKEDAVAQETVEFRTSVPYVSGFLAFREVPHIADCLRQLFCRFADSLPALKDRSVLIVDGNGVWHPRRCGAATHLGLCMGMPAIGVAKSCLATEGVTEAAVKEDVRSLRLDCCCRDEDWAVCPHRQLLVRAPATNRILGMAVCAGGRTRNPTFVSVGHKMSLASAVALVARCSRHRQCLPVRLADMLSRSVVGTWDS